MLSLVPNGQLRLATLGLADRPAEDAELAEMQVLLRESLDHGAWGYSTGLEYAQEQAASEEELTALAREAPFYATHTRKRDEGAADAVAEAIRTGANAEVRLQVSHLVPRNGIEESRRCIELVEDRARRGAGRRVRHAHAHLRADEPLRGPARLGARRRAATSSRRSCAIRRSATRCARTARS